MGFPPINKRIHNGVALVALAVCTAACAVRKARVVAVLPAPPKSASAAQLIAKINAQSSAFTTLEATVELAPAAGSVNSGIIKQYHDVKGFLLVRKPDFIRMTGQAPVVHTDIFDMASGEGRFSLYIPSDNKFYVGAANLPPKPGKTFENLRPEHILGALLIQPIDPQKDSYFLEEVSQDAELDYVIGDLGPFKAGQMNLKRKIWFNRSDLEISRLQLYANSGQCVEDVRYGDYENLGRAPFPLRIAINRPVEDISLTITLLKTQFNLPVPLSKFDLKKPSSAQLVDLGGNPAAGTQDGQ
ncbi:MAG: DUF4292 domain-containing protein [Acidobacteriota bacterium]|nr:DUF4292 domain-containing protein [Acidobacteriota bacterium]